MIKTLLSAVLIAASLLSFGCKDDDDDPVNCSNWAIDIQAEANAVSTTSQAYYLDVTNNAKCVAYKNALEAYGNALVDAEGCAAQVNQQAEWQAAVDAVALEAASLPC